MSSEAESIHLEFEVTEDDFVDFASYYYQYSAEGKRGRLRALLLGAAVFTFFAASEWNNPDHGIGEPLKFALYMGSAVLMVALALALYHYLFRPAIMRRMARNSTFSKMLGKTSLVITPAGINLTSASGRGILPWSDVRRMGETTGHVFLLIGPMRAIIIPHRAFLEGARENALDAMRAWHNAAAP
jgi:hypothetical protein